MHEHVNVSAIELIWRLGNSCGREVNSRHGVVQPTNIEWKLPINFGAIDLTSFAFSGSMLPSQPNCPFLNGKYTHDNLAMTSNILCARCTKNWAEK
jgi:hypothetical protein